MSSMGQLKPDNLKSLKSVRQWRFIEILMRGTKVEVSEFGQSIPDTSVPKNGVNR